MLCLNTLAARAAHAAHAAHATHATHAAPAGIAASAHATLPDVSSQVSPECARKNKPPAPLARVGRAQFSPRAMASHAAFRAPLGRQLGTRSTCRSSSSPSLRAALVPVRRGAARSARRVVALDRSREGGLGGDDGAMDTNVLYERMRALQAKEASENSAIVEAAIEKDQAIVAGIKGDAAERPTPERACHERALRCAPPRAMRPRSHQSVYW